MATLSYTVSSATFIDLFIAARTLIRLSETMWVGYCLSSFVIAGSVLEGALAFQLSGTRISRTLPPNVKTSNSRLNLVPGVETIGIAIVSAAAGAAAQVPRIQELEGELAEAKGSLEQSKLQMVAKINELEEKLFQMDNAYEEQSAKFMKEYETRKNAEVEKIADKIKTDYQYKLEIEVEKEKSKLLSKKLTEVKLGGDQSARLSEMKLKMEQLRMAKEKLETALEKSEHELKRIGEVGKKKSGFWPF